MRCMALASLLALGLTGPALAEDNSPGGIIAAAIGDWNKDGRQDLALLVASNGADADIGIYIYLRDADHDLLKLAAAAPNKVTGNASLDASYGQDPSVEALANGSIAVHSQNSGIGRDRWNQTLTIADRDGAFVIAGYTYNYYDTLDPKAAGSCDYNVLTGKVTVDRKDHKAPPRTISITDWNDQIGQTACGIKQE